MTAPREWPAAVLEETSWTLPGALTTEAFPRASACAVMPLLALLREAAAFGPERIALTSLTASLSYGELLRLALNTAGAVAARVPPGAAVACSQTRHPLGIAALLGCLITGRPCMIIDAADPVPRRAELLADAAPALLLTEEAAPPWYSGVVLPLHDALAGSDEVWRPDPVWDPDAAFIVHFTSGSTGRPRGIVLSARSTLYRAMYAVETMSVTSESRMVHPNMPIASGGLSTLLGILAVAGRAVLIDLAGDGAGSTLRLIEREAVTHAWFPPSMLRMLTKLQRARPAFAALRVLRLGGSALPWADVWDWRPTLPAGCVVLHGYGSTEALNIAEWRLPDRPEPAREMDGDRVPAGIAHLRHEYALLDDDGQAVAEGEAGELVLRSQYVALGEWRDGRIQPGRMRTVAGRPGWRVFPTGDTVRVGADGMLHILGRVDRQVKINGVLVQPAEIEAVLKAEPGVLDAAVVSDRTPSGAVLHGYIVAPAANELALIAALRRRLATRLPAAFRPARFTLLERLPVLPGGKTDFIALSNPVED